MGQPARHRLGWEGMVEKLEAGRAEVLVRGKRIRCRPEELTPLGAVGSIAAGGAAGGPSRRERREAAAEMTPRARAAAAVDLDQAAAVAPEINLIGQRVEPALEQLDSYLDRALLASQGEVRVIHGHGSGALRQAVRAHLKAHRAVSSLRAGDPNEGGNGATVVVLRSR